MTMKTLRISLFVFAICFMTIQADGQNWGWGEKDKGPVKKETRSVTDFNSISVGGGIDLYIKQGNKQNVTVKASESVIDRLMTEVENGRLRIYLKKGKYRNAKMDVFVVVDDLEALHASGGSDVYGQTPFQADDFELHASGGSDVEMNLEVERLECHLTGGSDTVLEGSANHLHIEASGSSDFEGFKLETKHCVINASGSSDANVTASESLEVHASGSSDVNYKGKPSKTNIQASGSSDVHSY